MYPTDVEWAVGVLVFVLVLWGAGAGVGHMLREK